jgi:hypothetical protein
MNHLLFEIAGQIPPDPSDPAWPYWVAIGALSTAVSALFGLLQRNSGRHEKRLDELHETHRKADQEFRARVQEEMAAKDKAILEASVEFAKLMERVANELRDLNRGGNNRNGRAG